MVTNRANQANGEVERLNAILGRVERRLLRSAKRRKSTTLKRAYKEAAARVRRISH